MLKTILLYSTISLLILASCKKTEPVSGPIDNSFAYVSFTNVNPSAKQVNVFVDGAKISNANYIAPYATLVGIYAGLTPGTRTIALRDTTTTSTIEYYTNGITVTGGQSYSFYLYDILTAGKFKGLLLNTDRTPDASAANCKVRFLNLSPGSPALDLVLIRREASVAKDSIVLFSASTYVGNAATPDITALSAFKSVLANKLASATTPATDYILKAKVSSTGVVVSTSAATTLVNGRNYTFFARGIYPSVTLTSMFNN